MICFYILSNVLYAINRAVVLILPVPAKVFLKKEVYSLINYGEMYLLTKVAWGKFVHSPGWGHFGHPNTL